MIRSLIYASARNDAIGRRGELPWDIPSDLAYFRRKTLGLAVIMGRLTAESIMKRQGKLLPGRFNIVVSSTLRLDESIGHVVPDLASAWHLAETLGALKAFVIGGRRLYCEAIEQVDEFEHTAVEAWPKDADTFFRPDGCAGMDNLIADAAKGIDRRVWQCTWHEEPSRGSKDDHYIRFERWERRASRPQTQGAQPPLYYLGNSRSQAQTDEMIGLEAKGICIFCPEHWNRGGGKVVLHENAGWALVDSDYPYPGTSRHMMLLPREHVSMLTDLSPVARASYWEMLDYVVANYGLTYFGTGARNGDMRYTGATIAHLHIHIIVGDPDNEGDAVKLFLSSRPKPDPSP